MNVGHIAGYGKGRFDISLQIFNSQYISYSMTEVQKKKNYLMIVLIVFLKYSL